MDFLTARQAVSLYEPVNPFGSAAALRCSNYSAYIDESLVRLLDWRDPTPQARLADNALRAFLSGTTFSCVAGKAALASGGYRFGYYGAFSKLSSAEGLARDLAAFVAERPSMCVPYASLIATFDEPQCGDERWFEHHLWRQLQRLHDLSAAHYDWSPGVSKDPAAPDFAFSFAGQAFFVVGMHPNSSRVSRRFFLPALAFNAHSQFERARRSGQFERIQRLVRQRDMTLQGSINPELCEFGTRSEARQYSGRRIEEDWWCPFRPNS